MFWVIFYISIYICTWYWDLIYMLTNVSLCCPICHIRTYTLATVHDSQFLLWLEYTANSFPYIWTEFILMSPYWKTNMNWCNITTTSAQVWSEVRIHNAMGGTVDCFATSTNKTLISFIDQGFLPRISSGSSYFQLGKSTVWGIWGGNQIINTSYWTIRYFVYI